MSSRIAFYIDETMTDSDGRFIPALCHRGEPGYTPTTYRLTGSFAAAQEWVNDRNLDLGMTRADALKLVATTFGCAS